jgi:hypothetical protein
LRRPARTVIRLRVQEAIVRRPRAVSLSRTVLAPRRLNRSVRARASLPALTRTLPLRRAATFTLNAPRCRMLVESTERSETFTRGAAACAPAVRASASTTPSTAARITGRASTRFPV